MFFDTYPRFYETSRTSPSRGRLNLRYEAILGENRDLFEGARVLDIASHDGRWSLAALKTGASEVVGIEAKDHLVAAAYENLSQYCDDTGAYRFVCGDIFDVLANETFDADVVLCLGFLYHTLRYNELMQGIRAVAPRHLIVDTRVIPAKRPLVLVKCDRADREGTAVADRFSYGGKTVVGVPSVAALNALLGAYDFRVERFSDWGSLVRDNPSFEAGGYSSGRRVTARCVSKI
jgi:SAM-dependent methyltransferase